ncbi:hydantoinase B/oxoprolinase family protein [Aureliella helgolandensis]|uniref:Acetophenone carboxylase gamma subunit n=1 Tax=Aureliella helgolandensis TaxID=2527968 RepID=A0A518G636_9BACT|nr:hydantoinase B/oxoprolinase family protein [Aureliella helgolandensis]QDV24055.1 Acetophenone carboxylase gamma subunit [Aureliella helgolandensis]
MTAANKKTYHSTSTTRPEIEAWIDVGGTFTDCFIQRAGHPLRSCKVLSSGRIPLSLQSQPSPSSLRSHTLQGDRENFWVGAHLQLLDPHGGLLQKYLITGSSGAELTVATPMPQLGPAVRLEIVTELEAPILGVRRLLGVPLTQRLPPLAVRMGTTRGTNALLTRQGARTGLAVTSPFEDLLKIGDQTRPELFALSIVKPEPLSLLSAGISERLDAKGQVLQPLDLTQSAKQLQKLRDAGCTSLAICLMHSYANPVHELQLRDLARQFSFEHVSVSSLLVPLIEIVARAQTTVVDAYLSPIVRGYLHRIVEQFGGMEADDLQVMTSAGGLVPWQQYSGKDSILSGPAGGVAALSAISHALQPPESSRFIEKPAEATNEDTKTAQGRPLIGLDMGGTSTDVCRVGGEPLLQYESTKAGVRILTPTLPIETVAAGGGSVCWFDGVSLRVGPHSAGASPGPACYGRGGPLTVTDLNVFLGRVPVEQFPLPLDIAAIADRLDALRLETKQVLGAFSSQELAQGFRCIANEQMAGAVRTVSIAQGVDPREHTLMGFGGAAGQHICEIADILGVQSIVDSQDGGLLSALGMGLAARRADAVLSVYKPLIECNWSEIETALGTTTRELRQQFEPSSTNVANLAFDPNADATGRPTSGSSSVGNAMEENDSVGMGSQVVATYWLEFRYVGTDVTLTLPWEARSQAKQRFDQLHHHRYGYSQPDSAIELVAVRVECSQPAPNRLPAMRPVDACALSAWEETGESFVPRASLNPGGRLQGPKIVANQGSTLFIEAGWWAEVLSDGTLWLEREEAHTSTASLENAAAENAHAMDPVFRDCFAQRLTAIATQMGQVLQQTARSVNVKQRRDFSCAVFDARGHLLANAPHVPVHLGAMGLTVRAVMEDFPMVEPGDSFISNDPYRGGSHLPDLTVVTPVFARPPGSRPLFWVANRAHHADIGGISPGSMSIEATRLGEEGVVIPPFRLLAAGNQQHARLAQLMADAPFPPRNIRENLADIAAQQAANARGVQLLSEYAAATSWRKLTQYSDYLLDAAESRVRNFIRERYELHQPRSLSYRFSDALEDGTPICVNIVFPGRGNMRIDFAGTGGVSSQNFNANPSIVSAAVLYVLRCLIADDLPLNEGVMRCVDLRIPISVLNPPLAENHVDSPAVAAGNVETSQRVVDVLLGALGAAAASQGTMNNLLFGNAHFGFYETLCGGAGATRGADGASGVHTHMTNTRLTDPEILESQYPVRLREFCLRVGSGGAGRWQGGNGVRRAIEFLEPVELSLLTSRRTGPPPFGLAGGKPGALGRNRLVQASGTTIELPANCRMAVIAGDQLILETPGGGGLGESESTQ